MRQILWMAIILPTMLTAQVDISKREVKADTLKARVTKLYIRGVMQSNDSASFKNVVRVNGDSLVSAAKLRNGDYGSFGGGVGIQDSSWNSIQVIGRNPGFEYSTKIDSSEIHITEGASTYDMYITGRYVISDYLKAWNDHLTYRNYSNDSVTITPQGITQVNNGVEVLSTDMAGNVDITGEYRINGTPINTTAPDTVNEVETRFHAAQTYHPSLGLTTLNLSVDTIKARGKIKINDSTVIYLPNQSASLFQGSMYIGNGGVKSTHSTGTQGQQNVSIGFGALYNNTSGSKNFALGYNSMFSNTTGFGCTAIGAFSLNANTTGPNNTAVGQNALLTSTTAGSNTAIGLNAGSSNITGQRNVFIGGSTANNGNYDSCFIAGFRTAFGTTGKGLNQKAQIKIGSQAGYTDTTNYTLYIDNSSTSNFQTPLIGGRLDLNRISINKLMPACGDSTFNVGGGIKVDGGVKVLGDVSYNIKHAEMYISGATYTPDVTLNVPFKITPGMSVTESVGITMQGDSVISQINADYDVTLAVTLTGSNATDWRLSLYKNGSVWHDEPIISTTGTSNNISLTWPWYIDLNVSDHFSFRITNLSDSSDPVIKNMKVIMKKVHNN